ncbi:MAG: efflux RND transporter periplasmic adaptor subunit [Gammaproteobacteria bacterium]|nr:efflux RND transporter periplasmic adaptor subunit [Gammaproteobacteria bacterium]
MSEHSTEQHVYERRPPWVAHFLVSVVILLVAFAIISMMFSNKPEGKKWGGRPAPSVAVEVKALEPTDYQVWIDSYGTANSLTQTQLVADVSGRVIEVSSKIRAGSSFKQGDVLVRLEDRDFKVEVDIAASSVADAEVQYLQEVAQAELAQKEWNIRPDNKAAQALALRKPQVAAAKASLEAAKARLAKAKLNLERTQVKAPFDGKVMRQMVDLGQVVSPSQAIAEIYSTDTVEVRLPFKISDLDHLRIPEENATEAEQPKVVFEGELGARTYQWEGHVVRSEGAFDTATRMLYVVAEIDQPFVSNEQRPAIRIGQFLRAKVQGDRLDNVFVIPRRAVSQDYQISIAQEGVLKKRRVTPLWTDTKSVVVSAATALDNQFDGENFSSKQPSPALAASDRIILTPTANLPDGTRIKSIGDGTANASSDGEKPDKDASGKMANDQESGPSDGASTTVKSKASR